MNPFLAGHEFDARIGSEWFHIIVERSELAAGTFEPLRLRVDMVLLPLEREELTEDITQWNVLGIEKGS